MLGSSIIALVALIWSAISGILAQVALPPLFIGTILVVSLAVPAGLLLFRLADPLGWLAGRFPWSAKLTAHPQLTRLADTVKQYPVKALYNSFLSSLPFTLALILTQYCIAQGLQVELPFSVFALFVPIISLVNLLPISFNGLGTREGIYLVLFTPLGIAADRVIAMALLLYIVRVLTGLLGGLFFLLKSLGNLPTRHSQKTT